jgi:type I restriction enzyme M protein
MANKVEIIRENGKIFAPLKDKWLLEKPEEIVRQNFIARLANHYGYDLKQMAQELKVTHSKRGTGKAQADIVIWKSEKDRLEEKSAFIVVECKAENIRIREEDYFQGYNYASWAGATFFVTTNERETKFFKVVKDKLPKDLEQIVDIPHFSIINNENKIKKLLATTRKFERDEFAKLLFKCHNIIRNNDKLSPEAAFDEISKILFMKIRYERNPSEYVIFSLKKFQEDEKHYEENVRPYLRGEDKEVPYIQILFRHTKKEFEQDELFDENEPIRIRKASYEAIIKELERYNLSDTSDDVKGIAFEEFLGKTFRGELGQFFTPRTIVDFMVETLDPQEGEIICDPCAGSGGFLIRVFEYIRERIEEDIHKYKEKIKKEYFTEEFEKLKEEQQEEISTKIVGLFAKLNEELDPGNKKSRLYNLSYRSIYGTDANPRMARTAKMNMIMHGDGHGGVHHNDGLLNINGIFENRFDVILTNPPFGSRVEKSLKITEADLFTDKDKIQYYSERYGNEYKEAMKQVNENLNKPILDLYDLGNVSGLTEVLFMERCLKLLKPGGRMGIVLPEGVLNNPNLQKVRDYFEGKAKVILITSIPQDVFIASGAMVKPSLVFLKKFTEKKMKQYDTISAEINNEVNKKYASDIEKLNEAIKSKENLKEQKKELRKELKKLHQKIDKEIKSEIKIRFDYEIPIAEVKKAGIDSKGAKCENQLETLAKEFTKYRKQNKLWKYINHTVKYEIIDDNIYRSMMAGEPEIFYG